MRHIVQLDALRALGSDCQAFQVLKSEAKRSLETVRDRRLANATRVAQSALEHAESWLAQAKKNGATALETDARRFAITLGRAFELVLLIKHAQWSKDNKDDGRATAAARRFASLGIDALISQDIDDARLLLSEQ